MTHLLCDTPEAAERLGVSASWLKKQVGAGLVQHTRVGRLVRFSEADLDHFIASRRQPAVTGRRLRATA